MVTNTTATMEIVDTGEKRDQRGRRIMPAGRREELVVCWRKSGLTQAEFSRREGINYTTFCSWVHQSRAGASAKVRFAEVHMPGAASAPSVEVHMGDGTLVRGTNASEVAAVVRALRD
jgi:hypothetical protein